MASDNEACCESDPNFAVICGFLEKFGVTCGLTNIDFLDLQDMLENNQQVPQELIDLHVKLLRKARKSVSSERWERAIIKLCHSFCSQDAWEIERFGYKNARLSSKLRILKELLEMQFDYNAKFKNEVNKLSADELRTQPLGKDRNGHVYWFQSDNNCQIRVYKEDPDEETWSLVAKDREGLVGLITQLGDGKESVVNEDSNSLESEKPVVDTGQPDINSNSTSTKTDQINTEEEKITEPEEEEEFKEKPQVVKEDNAQSDSEVLKLGKIKLITKKISASVEEEKTNEIGRLDDIEKTNEIKKVEDIEKTNEIGKVDHMEKTNEIGKVDDMEKTNEIRKVDDIEKPNEIRKVDDIEKTNDTNKAGDVMNEVNETVNNSNNNLNDHEIKNDSNLEKEEKEQLPPDPPETSKSGISIRIKPISELISNSTSAEVNKKLEITGVKEKYIRSDSCSYSSSVHHRKAVDSAGFDVHANDLKRPIEEEEDVDEPSYIKRPRLDRPTLLGNKKKKPYSDEEEEDDVSDEIEEPLMLVTGDGSGRDNECGNCTILEYSNIETSPIVGDVIEESIMYFCGEGYGHECETGNENNSNRQNSKEKSNCTSESQHKTDKADTTCSINVNNPSGSVDESNSSVKTSPKVEYKLGTIIDVRTNNSISCAKDPNKKSRWDIGKPDESLSGESQTTNVQIEGTSSLVCNSDSEMKPESEKVGASVPITETSNLNLDRSPTYCSDEGTDNTTVTPKKSMFFFGPGCLKVKPTISPLKNTSTAEFDEKSISSEETTGEMETMLGNSEKVDDLSSSTEQETNYNLKESSKHEDFVTSVHESEEGSKIQEKQHQTNDNSILKAGVSKDIEDNKTSLIQQKSETTTDLTKSDNIAIDVSSTSLNVNLCKTEKLITEDALNETAKDTFTSLDISETNLTQPKENAVTTKQFEPNVDVIDNQSKIINKNCSLTSNSASATNVPKSIVSDGKKFENVKDLTQSNCKINFNQKLIDVPVTDKFFNKDSLLVKHSKEISETLEESLPVKLVDESASTSDDKPKNKLEDIQRETIEKTDNLGLSMKKANTKSLETHIVVSATKPLPVSTSVTNEELQKNSIVTNASKNSNNDLSSISLFDKQNEKSSSALEINLDRPASNKQEKSSDSQSVLNEALLPTRVSNVKVKSTDTKEIPALQKSQSCKKVIEEEAILVNKTETSKEDTCNAPAKRTGNKEAPANNQSLDSLKSSDAKVEDSIKIKDSIVMKSVTQSEETIAEESLSSNQSVEEQSLDKISQQQGDILPSDLKKLKDKCPSTKTEDKSITRTTKQTSQEDSSISNKIKDVEVKDTKLSTVSSEADDLPKKRKDLKKASMVDSTVNLKLPTNKDRDKVPTELAKENKVSREISVSKTTVHDPSCTAVIKSKEISKKNKERGKNQIDNTSVILKDESDAKNNTQANKQKIEVSSSSKTNKAKSDVNVTLKPTYDKKSTKEKPAFNIKEVITNAISVFPSNENMSRIDISKISLTEILSTSEKIPDSAVKGVTDSIRCFTSKLPSPISNVDHLKPIEVKPICDSGNKTSKIGSGDKDISKKPNKASGLDSSENKEIPKNKELLESSEENVKKYTKQSAVIPKKIDLKDAPKPIVLLDSLQIDKKTEKALNKHNKITAETTSKKSTVDAEGKKSTKSSVAKNKNVDNSLKTDKTDSTKIQNITDVTENASSPSADEIVTNRRVTRRTRNSNVEKIDLTEEKSSTNKTSAVTNKTENSSSQIISKRTTRKSTTERIEENTVDNHSVELEKTEGDTVRPQSKGKQLRKHKTNVKENKDASSEANTETKQKIDENVSEEPKIKNRAKSNNKANTSNTTKTRSQAKQNINKTEESKKNETEVVDLEDIEEQIIHTEIRPSKKLKVSDAVEITVVDKNKRTTTTEKIKHSENEPKEDDKKVPPRTRRSLRSNQQSSADQNKIVEETTEDQSDNNKPEENKTLENNATPVDEPKCVQKKVPLLTNDTTKSKIKNEDEAEADSNKKPIASPDSIHSIGAIGEDTDGISSDDATKDAAINSEEDVKEASESINEPPMTLSSFKLDTEDVSAVRVTRKRAAQQSVDALRDNQDKSNQLTKKDEVDNKRPKLKKRSVDRNLRRSIEEQKLKEVSSSEDDKNEDLVPAKQGNAKKNKSIAKRRVSTRSTRATDSPAPSSDALSETSRTDASNTPPVVKQKKPRRQKKTLLGLEISEEIESIMKNETPIGVRQSRRIAQLKIKEEAERRKLEEVTLQELKDEQKKRKGKKNEDKDYKVEQKKRNKSLPSEDETTMDAESDEKKKRKRKRKHWNPTSKFDIFKAWKTSSGSSSSEVEDEEEEIEEDDDHPLVLKSDHEFSPESDLEEGGEAQPLKRARTARKESDAEEEVDDCACQKCGQKDHPEWILLCDNCDCGWHCSCLRPALLVIPEGDWFCPPCQHITLVKSLEARLIEYDKKINKREMETRRKERLAYVGISLDNVLPSKDSDEHRSKHRHQHDREKESSREDDERESDEEDDESGSDDSSSESESSSSSDSDSEPIYQLRERRQAHSYRFNEYDELINSAIQEELDAVKGAGNQGRGKDIANIVNVEKEEAAEAVCLKNQTEGDVIKADIAGDITGDITIEAPVTDPNIENTVPSEPLPPVVPLNYDSKPVEENDSDNEEIIRPVKKIIGKKKHRKLNSLDVSSEDDAESDEDFKGSSTSESEEDFDEYSGSESSDDGRRGKRRKDFGPVRRSTRARISRYDRDFINDDTSDDGEAPRRKKTRSLWDESESEESDRSWGKRKRKAAKKTSKSVLELVEHNNLFPTTKNIVTSAKKVGGNVTALVAGNSSVPERSKRRPSTGKVKKSKKKKKKRSGDDSDPEVYRKRPNIKYGGLNDDEEVVRRTRGKKINYLEALGTDSEEEMRRKPPRIEESEEEYNVHEDEEFQQHLENAKEDSDESGVENVFRDIAAMPRTKPKGRGKAGLKIPRRPKDAPPLEFPPMLSDLSQQPINPVPPTMMNPVLQPLDAASQLAAQPQLLEPPFVQDSELLDIDDELDPIEQINKNVEQMNEQEMEKMMEEEDYANKQLQLIALQIEKEKKRKELQAKKLEQQLMEQKEQKIPKKRGRKPKNQMLNAGTEVISPMQFTPNEPSSMLINSVMTNNAELSEPPGVNLPMFSEIAPALNADGTPKKRRGRGKGKKTLAAEAAAAAAAGGKGNPEIELGPEGASSGSNTVSPAPDSPMHSSKLGIAAPPQPFSQSQPTPSVITRMLQSQPGQGNFPIGNAKYFSGGPNDPSLGPPPVSGAYHPGATGPRGPIPGPYQQPPPGMPHYPVVRGGPTPPHRLHSPGPPPGLPPMYHSHRPMDPSPSGGGPINVSTANRDRHSPAIVPPTSSSPLSKGDPTPPPPPYTRPQVGHFPPGPVSSAPPTLPPTGPRHISMVPPHLQQHRPTNMSPYHPGVPPNYHYGSYPPPPPLTADEGQPPPPVFSNSPYSEPYPNEGGPPPIPASESSTSTKPFDEETGEFGGLVSYFSSQREDDLET